MNCNFLFILLVSLLRINALPLFAGFHSTAPVSTAKETELDEQQRKESGNALMRLLKRADLNTVMNYANLASTGLMLVSTAASLSDYFKSKKQQSAAAKSSTAEATVEPAAAEPAAVVTETASPVYVTATINPVSATTLATVVYVTDVSTSSIETPQETQYVTVTK